jgi:cytochrome c-type biogenesis protein CcmH
VLNFLVARYGEFVLLRPPLAWHTAALWGLPPAALLIGVAAMIIVARRRRRHVSAAAAANLTADEERRLSDLLRDA